MQKDFPLLLGPSVGFPPGTVAHCSLPEPGMKNTLFGYVGTSAIHNQTTSLKRDQLPSPERAIHGSYCLFLRNCCLRTIGKRALEVLPTRSLAGSSHVPLTLAIHRYISGSLRVGTMASQSISCRASSRAPAPKLVYNILYCFSLALNTLPNITIHWVLPPN